MNKSTDAWEAFDALEETLGMFPQLRLGQVIANALEPGEDIFYVEDERLKEALEEYMRGMGSK